MSDDDDKMSAEEQAEWDLRMALETSIEDLEVALKLGDWEGPPYKFMVEEEAERAANTTDDGHELETEEQTEYEWADRGRSREKVEDAINRLHIQITDIAAAGSVRNFLDGKKE